MSDLLDASAHWGAVKALIVASFGADVYDFGKVPGESGNTGTLPAKYVTLTVERRFVPANNGFTSVSGWRISARFVGTTPANARLAGTKVTAALNETRLTVAGATSTPIAHDSSTAVEADDGMFSGLSQWTYAISN